MTDYPIRVTPAGYQVGATTDGRDWRPIGPIHETPREAIDYVKALEDRITDVRAGVDAPRQAGVAHDAIPTPVTAPGPFHRPTTPGGDEPDLTGGFWGAVESRNGERRHRGSPGAPSPRPAGA